MMDTVLSILALVAGGLTLELFSSALPPLGSENQSRLRAESDALTTHEELQAGNTS